MSFSSPPSKNLIPFISFLYSTLHCNFLFQLPESMSNEEYNDMTQNYTFNDDEEIKTGKKSNTVITEERREEFRKIKFGLVKPTPFDELLKMAVRKKSSNFVRRLVCVICMCTIKRTKSFLFTFNTWLT